MLRRDERDRRGARVALFGAACVAVGRDYPSSLAAEVARSLSTQPNAAALGASALEKPVGPPQGGLVNTQTATIGLKGNKRRKSERRSDGMYAVGARS